MSDRAPYGTWKSRISAERITGSSISKQDIIVDAVTSVVYHLEDRPAEKGRSVLVESETGREIVKKEVDVRTGVHEYGGAAAIVHDSIVYYSDISDNRLYRLAVKEGSQAEPVTPENDAFRYACFDVHPTNPRILVSILEDHTNDTPSTVVNTLVMINTETMTVTPLVSGADFYAFPRFSPDGSSLSWQEWDHPNMPWDISKLIVADISETLTLSNITTISKDGFSNGFPAWASKHTLCWLCDVSGFINPWKYDVLTKKAWPVFSSPLDEDFAPAMWELSFSTFAFIDEEGKHGVFKSFKDGRSVLYQVNIVTGERKQFQNPYVVVEYVRTVSKSKGQFAFLGTKVDESDRIILGTVKSDPASFVPILASDAAPSPFDPELVSIPRGISLKVPSNDEPLHVIYYPPHNPAYSGTSIDGEKPPCVVNVHGGPTGMAYPGLEWNIQFWTTRGFAWLDVNYGGSYGYGKTYMNRLKYGWGVVDVEDCITASQLLSSPPHSLIDPKRIVIRGSSSGGLTVLGTLCNSSNTTVYAAATSYFGVTDLVGLMKVTHKFESHYGFELVGASPENQKSFETRSPINYVDKINRPLLILQGDIDRVVPKEQAEAIYESIKGRGGIVEYKLYPGEGHGFRMKETQCDALERELAFYQRALGLQI